MAHEATVGRNTDDHELAAAAAFWLHVPRVASDIEHSRRSAAPHVLDESPAQESDTAGTTVAPLPYPIMRQAQVAAEKLGRFTPAELEADYTLEMKTTPTTA